MTLIEIAIGMVILGILLVVAIPSMSGWAENGRLNSTARAIDGAIGLARSEAIRTGNIHLVFFGLDAQGNVLVDHKGDPAQVVVVDDGQAGSVNQNCRIDAGETSYGLSLERDVSWGQTGGGGPVTTDTGLGAVTGGTTFRDAAGNPAVWVLFRPEGPPLAFSPNCTTGLIGTGGGGAYLTNGNRDKAIVVTPLGATRIHSWSSAGWTS